MKKASETNQDGILDEGLYHHGGELGWSSISGMGAAQVPPDELVMHFEDGEDVSPGRSVLLRLMLGLCLVDFARDQDALRVGEKAISLAGALGHPRGSGVMPGARRAVCDVGSLNEARVVLEWWFTGKFEVALVGRRVLAIAKFLDFGGLADQSMSVLGRVCGETPAGMMERVREVCNRPIQKAGGIGHAAWQQGPDQREGSAKAQLKFHQRKRAKVKVKPRGRLEN